MVEFKDSYAGWIAVTLVRCGKGFRFQTIRGSSIGTFRSPFKTKEQALECIKRYPAIFRTV